MTDVSGLVLGPVIVAITITLLDVLRHAGGLKNEPPERDTLLEQQADYAGALASIDAVQPLDNLSLRRREELALRLSVRTGNVDRARQAAERLFGLRLDTDAQIVLSGQMHQLGLHELAEALLGRARRRAGNKSSALVTLMLQVLRHGLIPANVRRLMCLSMFWHFLDVVWIGVFTFVYLMGVLP